MNLMIDDLREIADCLEKEGPIGIKAIEACEKLDQLDWIAGYELIGDNQSILQEALDVAREVLRMRSSLEEGSRNK